MNSKKFKVSDCEILTFPKVNDARGNLSFIEERVHIPFEIKRIFYIYDVPTDTNRGAHAHKNLFQALIPISGSLNVSVFDGIDERNIKLDRPWIGLVIPPSIWAYEYNFASGTSYLVLASELYDESDYIRNKDSFMKYRNNKID